MSNSDEPIDVLVNQRLQFAQQNQGQQADGEPQDVKALFPPKLLRR